MAITKTYRDRNGGVKKTTSHYVGRVLKVEQVVEQRNWSDTLDYSDWRSTECVWALVWLGETGIPPMSRPGHRPWTWNLDGDPISEYNLVQVRPLEFWEQFAWVDCTNLFADRHGYHLDVSQDADMADGQEPLMWANYVAWEAYHKALREKQAKEAAEHEAERQRRIADENAKKAARQAKKEAKEQESKVKAEAMMARIPTKGTVVTVEGFTGTVFWRDVTKYRGVWSARFGVKDARGEVRWVDGSTWVG